MVDFQERFREIKSLAKATSSLSGNGGDSLFEESILMIRFSNVIKMVQESSSPENPEFLKSYLDVNEVELRKIGFVIPEICVRDQDVPGLCSPLYSGVIFIGKEVENFKKTQSYKASNINFGVLKGNPMNFENNEGSFSIEDYVKGVLIHETAHDYFHRYFLKEIALDKRVTKSIQLTSANEALAYFLQQELTGKRTLMDETIDDYSFKKNTENQGVEKDTFYKVFNYLTEESRSKGIEKVIIDLKETLIEGMFSKDKTPFPSFKSYALQNPEFMMAARSYLIGEPKKTNLSV
ncbi:hypothetical protein KY334_05345 [Candidatus Woesearchaeota archaeon]|nr:hypothetical protein [Candidatus Woesearchaeota archaeon]